jgi:lipopolysaccharide biosynthesis glycosyltransferase
MRILFTTVCNDDYALGGQVMLYSMRKNIKNLDNCDFKIYYNNEFASLSQENQDKFKKIMPNIIFEHVNKECYFNSKLPPAGNRAQGCKAAYLTLESFNETEYDKVIMFDIDMLCVGDLSDLFNNDIQFGIHNRNTGFVVLGKKYRNEEIYKDLTSKIYSHDGQFMDQGIINKTFASIFQSLPKIYNQYPLSTINDDTRILHWAHYDHIKPWVLDEWRDKVNLFQDVPPYPHPNKQTGNVPILTDKPAFDLWEDYKKEMEKNLLWR